MARTQKNKVTDYNDDIQDLFVQFMISNRDLFTQAKPILSHTYFGSAIKPVVKYLMEYSEDFNDIPTTEQIRAFTGVKLTTIDETTVLQKKDWFLKEIEEFCRHKAIEEIVLNGPDYLEQGKYGDLEANLKDAVMISLNRDLGTSYFNDPKQRLVDMINNSARESTGWLDIDKKLYGGFAPGELNIFAAGSGGGKSLFLQNLAVNWVRNGKFVVYISLELSEHLVSSRIDAMMTGIATKDVTKKMDDVDLALRQIKKKVGEGDLYIKKLPEGGTTVNTLKAYLKELQIQTGRKPDAILVDYLDLMTPNRKGVDVSNLNIKDKFVSEELRALAHELDMLMGTASQLNRGASEESGDYEHHHIAGGLSKIQTADNVIAIYRSSVMMEQGQFQIKFMKTRSSAGVNQKCMLKFSDITLRISDDDSDANGVASTGNSNVSQSVLAKLSQTSPAAPSGTQSAPKPKTNAMDLINKVKRNM